MYFRARLSDFSLRERRSSESGLSLRSAGTMPYVRFADTNGTLVGVYSDVSAPSAETWAARNGADGIEADDVQRLTATEAAEHARDLETLLTTTITGVVGDGTTPTTGLTLNSLLIGERGLFVVDREPGQECSSLSVDALLDAVNGGRRAYGLQSPLTVYLPRMYRGIFDEAQAQARLLRELRNASLVSV